MKSKKLKKLIAVAIVTTMVATAVPSTAYASWLKDSQNSWSFIEGGNKVTGWKQVNGVWYHFDASGKMQTGWIQTADSKWYYLNADGGMKTGWLKDTNGKWYYLASSGEMRTGWIQDVDGKWYFSDISGAMQTGVIQVQGKTYVLEASGAMATGSVVIDGVTYTFDVSGAVIGDKLPTPGKVFTNEGRVKEENVTENKGSEITTETTTSSSSHRSSRRNTSSSNSSNIISGQDLSCDEAGTYGPNSGTVEVNNVSVNTQGVTLKNIHIKGDLVLGEGIGEGDVYLENVTVDGTTIVKGGGENSIHFTDSVLATVIVNKNNGKIRLVVQGNSKVTEVQLESPAKLEESDLDEGATGFNDVEVTDDVQTGNEDSGLLVELLGSFETINSRATSVRIKFDEGTNIQALVLNAIAQVLGTGTINTATINSGADGSTLTSRPMNMVLRARSVSLRDQLGEITETISESYSNATSAALTGIKLGMDNIKVNMSNFVAGLTEDDFNITAKLDGQDCSLDFVYFDAESQRFTFEPVSLEDNIGKVLKVTITPASDKVTGEAQSDEITIKNGFSGQITDIQGVGISGVTINFREGENSRDGDIAGTVVTDEDGYYTAYLAPGEYTGEISGAGVIKTYMYASSLSDEFNTEQNETAIRATGMDSVKIVLTWGATPNDEDSHLEGPTTDGGAFHTWYSDRIYEENGIRYADLDWDDTNSYGPETTTIYKLVDGKYRFYVHNFSGQYGDSSLVGSGAKVEIYKGSNQIPINTVAIPNDTSKASSLYWLVFDMKVADNGETINVSEINELRKSMILKQADTAEASYYIHDGSYYDGSDIEEGGPGGSIYGSIKGVPTGTVADLKADLSAYDGGTLKVLAAGTDVSDVTEFNNASELAGLTPLSNDQIVAVKSQDGTTIRVYTIALVGTEEGPTDTIAPVITPVSNAYVTTSSAVTWTAPTTTAYDDGDGDVTNDIVTTYSSDDVGSNVTDLLSARTHLGEVGNTVRVTYNVNDVSENEAEPVSAIFTAVADTTTSAGATLTIEESIGTIDDDTDTILVADGTTLEEFKSATTTSAGAIFEVYEADGITEASDLQDGYKVIVTSEDDGTIIKEYIIKEDELV